MKRFILVVVSIVCIMLTGCRSIEKEERIPIDVMVQDMEYKGSYCTYHRIGKTLSTMYYPARYLVTISYEDITVTFNDQNLYESVKEGDIVKMILYQGYDEDGELVLEEIHLPE